MLLTLRSPLARAPYVVFFDLKPLLENGNLQVYMTVCMHEKEPQEPREYISEHVKSLGGVPLDPPHTINIAGPHFLYLPWAPPILLAALTMIGNSILLASIILKMVAVIQ